MAINESEGKTFNRVGVYLKKNFASYMGDFMLHVQEQGCLIVYFSNLKRILYKVLIKTNLQMLFFQTLTLNIT